LKTEYGRRQGGEGPDPRLSLFIKWLKRKQKSELKPEPEPEPESKSERIPRPIRSMMVPEPGAIIGGKRDK
jgi:hypothetical protein